MASDFEKLKLMLLSSIALFTIIIVISCRPVAGQELCGKEIGKWFLCASFFFYSLFSLAGVQTEKIWYLLHAVTVFLMGLSVYYIRNMAPILTSVSSIILSVVIFVCLLILVSPLVQFMMHLRSQRAADSRRHVSNRKRVAKTLDLMATRFKPAPDANSLQLVPESHAD